MNADPRQLARQLGHEFRHLSLLELALTHRSAASANNERLEFLGDALLGFVIAEALCERYPQADEGRLSRLRATLVKRESLARLARELNLGDYLRLGPGESRSGGHTRDSILADAFEALLGAVYLDGGFEAGRRVVLARFSDSLAATSLEHSNKDPKTRLQEWLQARRRPLPDYAVLRVRGEDHDQTFTVACTLTDADLVARGEGRSRRRAEQAAAQTMLEQLEHD